MLRAFGYPSRRLVEFRASRTTLLASPKDARKYAYEIIAAANEAEGIDQHRAWGFIAQYIANNIEDIEAMLLDAGIPDDPNDDRLLFAIGVLIGEWNTAFTQKEET
jgi:hypothetical protein